MVRWLFRPWLLVTLLAAAVVGALVVAWGFLQPGGAWLAATPLPVAAGDREVVWLYPATNPAAWERFITAVRSERLQKAFPGLVVQTTDAFPRGTLLTPEAALVLPGADGGPSPGRLVFRWYKLTGDWKTADWVEALLRRRPPPFAIIGGSSSDAALELARELRARGTALPEAQRPLLLLTTATADHVVTEAEDAAPESAEGGPAAGTPLLQVYPGRTFRFCFSNRQMAAAVTHFLWSRDDLRPDSDPAYMVEWEDDAYSRDLIEGFWGGLHSVAAERAARQWGWAAGSVAGRVPPPGGGPFPFDAAGRAASAFGFTLLPTPQLVDSSVGAFETPNRFESKVARDLVELVRALDEPVAHPPRQHRPLLVLTGQTAPCRRFLRALERYSPDLSRRFVVATGDAISFNTVYRDRVVAWPVQDFPFPLVFFCHRDPTDAAAGFDPAGPYAGRPTAATATDDVLLNEDLAEALVRVLAGPGGDSDTTTAARLLHRLRRDRSGSLTTQPGGTLFFDADGGPRAGTGEHVVCLRPRIVREEGDASERVLPEATVEVWAWRPGPAGVGHVWERVNGPLRVTYDEPPPVGGAPHDAE
jgi:hypothetical protein